MKETPATPAAASAQASLAAFRHLSLPEKALAIAQTQAMLFSNLAVRALAELLRAATPPKPGDRA